MRFFGLKFGLFEKGTKFEKIFHLIFDIEDGTWRPGIYLTTTSRLIKMHNNGEGVVSSNGELLCVETPSDWSTAMCPVARHRHFLGVSFSSDLQAGHMSLEDGTADWGVHDFCHPCDSS